MPRPIHLRSLLRSRRTASSVRPTSTSPNRILPSASLLSACTFLVALFLAACGEKKEVVKPCADCPLVVIEGRVNGGPGVLPAEVRAGRRAGGVDGTLEGRARTDDDGHYRLVLSPGAYDLSVTGAVGTPRELRLAWLGGRLTFVTQGDTVQLSAGSLTRHIDFELGALRAVITTPAAYRTQPLSMVVYPIGSRADFTVKALPTGATLEVISSPLPPGAYFVSFTWGDDSFWYPHEPERAGAGVVQVRAGEQTELPVDLPPPGQLRGHVLGSWQSMRLDQPPTIYAVGPDSTGSLALAEIGSDGRFAFDVLVPRDLRLRVLMDGRPRWVGAWGFREATVFHVRPSQVLDAPNYVESGLRIKFVSPVESQDEFVFMRVRLVRPDGRLVASISRDLSIARHLDLPNLDAGTYHIELRQARPFRDDWVGQWYDGAESLAVSTPVTLDQAGEAREIVFRPTRGARIPLRIRAAGGRTYEDARIYLNDADRLGDRESTVLLADADSTIWVRGIPTGRWYIGTEAPVGPPIWYPGTRVLLEAKAIEVKDGIDAPLLEWSLPR